LISLSNFSQKREKNLIQSLMKYSIPLKVPFTICLRFLDAF
jgi:hypothetical protein